jgi:uncharacterized protein YggE
MGNETSANSTPTTEKPPSKNRLQVSFPLDLRLVVFLLLAVIAAMIILWRPWDHTFDANARTVEVTGEATLSAEPNEYSFSPTYTFKNADKAAAIDESGKKQAELVKQLKVLGVADKQINTAIDGYEDYPYPPVYYNNQPTMEYNYSLQLTVTVPGRVQAQKVQDYLATTSPVGAVTPAAGFSDTKRKELESKAREQASRDARSKADQSAQNLGFTVRGVKKVSDGTGFGGPGDIQSGLMSATGSNAQMAAPTIQPGENKYTYAVTVTYFIK